MKKILLSSILVASLFGANEYEFGVGAGFANITSSPLDNYKYMNIRIGKYLKKNHILRFEVDKSTGNTDLTQTLLNVEHYFGNDKLQPYGYVGIGYQWVDGDYSNEIVADLGIGAKYHINDTWAAFLEGRVLRDFGNNDNHYGAILGIVYEIGAKPIQKVKIVDSDNDGVVDSKDKCINTPAGVKVDKNGCALDSDNDGIADYLDKCANTPAGVKVDKDGCALDSDNDGIADYLDKCANTPADVKVNKDGCPLSFTFHINFANNSAELNQEAILDIEEFAKFLMDNPEAKAVIEGYTDNKGSKTYNIKLSEKRAKSVYNELIKLGISADRLSYKGYGPANPIATNDTDEGKAQNRRVVAKINYK